MKNDGTARGGLAGIGTTALRVMLETEFSAPEFIEQKNRGGQSDDAQCNYFLPIHERKIR
jgi:hypothetical protein